MTQRPRPAFTPADPGTPERHWRSHLADTPGWRPRGPDLLVVSPHPDDEVLGVGGLMGVWGRGAGSVTVLSVTDGEAAYPDVEDLASTRRAELHRALSCLSPRIAVRALHIPDGEVAAHRQSLVDAVAEALTPACTLMLPYERDGHCDHEACGSIAAAFPEATVVRYPIWLWHHATPATIGDLRLARFPLPPVMRRAKARAIACFASQTDRSDDRPVLPAHVLTHFHRPYETLVL